MKPNNKRPWKPKPQQAPTHDRHAEPADILTVVKFIRTLPNDEYSVSDLFKILKRKFGNVDMDKVLHSGALKPKQAGTSMSSWSISTSLYKKVLIVR